MNVNDVITKLKVMLGAEEVVTAKFAEATLIDGTEVYTEGELQVGAILFVRAGEGADEDPFAPAGKHETSEGQIITVGENGEITDIADQADADSVEVDAEKEEDQIEMEEVEIEVPVEEELVPATEELLAGIADIIAPFTEEIAVLKEEVVTLSKRLEKMAAEPGAPKVTTNTFKEILDDKNAKMEAKLNMLRNLRK